MSKENAVLGKLFAGFDAGYYDLPQELLGRRRAEGRVSAELRALSAELAKVDAAAVRSRVVSELIEAAAKGHLPAGYEAAFIEAQDEMRRLAAAQSILSEARAELTDRTPYVAIRLSEEILANFLRPALEAILDRVRAGADLAARVPWGDDRTLVMADRKVREFHELVAKAQDDYVAIRSAQRQLKTLTGGPSDEAYHRFGELRNMPAIWPQRDSGVESIRGRAPWPDGVQRMVWLVTSEAVPWIPTAAECEAANDALIAANPRRGGVVAGDRGFVAVTSGSGLDRFRG
jgi:hypothetical protein